jgi:excisionase family DNA binding protein
VGARGDRFLESSVYGKHLLVEESKAEWLDLKALTGYACVSERTLREWLHRPIEPLPASRVGSKILVRRSTFDQWLENHRLKPVDVGCIVDDMLAGLTRTN